MKTLFLLLLPCCITLTSCTLLFNKEIDEYRLSSLNEEIKAPHGVNRFRILIGSSKNLSTEELASISIKISTGDSEITVPNRKGYPQDSNWIKNEPDVVVCWVFTSIENFKDEGLTSYHKKSMLRIKVETEDEGLKKHLSLWINTLD